MPQERACHEAIYMLPDQVVPEAWASHEAIYMLPDQVVPEASVAQYACQLVLFLTDGPGGPVCLAAGPPEPGHVGAGGSSPNPDRA
jgi:hypothetical protein